MSFRQTLKAAPTLFRVGFMQSIAYRAEMFVWILSSTMPLVMLALFAAVTPNRHQSPPLMLTPPISMSLAAMRGKSDVGGSQRRPSVTSAARSASPDSAGRRA